MYLKKMLLFASLSSHTHFDILQLTFKHQGTKKFLLELAIVRIIGQILLVHRTKKFGRIEECSN